MRKITSFILVMALMLISSMAVVRSASAEELKMVGTITKIELATDGKSATAILKDSKTEALVTISVTDDLTLDKFKDKRIVEGGKNLSKMFKKTAGC